MPKLRAVMLAGNLCDDSVVKQALAHTCARFGEGSESRTITLSVGCGAGTSIHVPRRMRSSLRQQHEANAEDEKDAVEPWSVHGPGLDVAATLSSSYHDGTLL